MFFLFLKIFLSFPKKRHFMEFFLDTNPDVSIGTKVVTGPHRHLDKNTFEEAKQSTGPRRNGNQIIIFR